MYPTRIPDVIFLVIVLHLIAYAVGAVGVVGARFQIERNFPVGHILNRPAAFI